MKKIAYVISAFPVLSETFIGNEIRAMELKGHAIVPFLFRRATGPAQPEDMELASRFIAIREIAASRAFSFLPDPKALSFLGEQKLLGRASLAWHALKIAGEALAQRCDHVHAHFAGGAAAHAIVAARFAGLPVSFTCHGHDVYAEPEDLEAKLRAADRVVAVCDTLRDDLRGMEGRANVVRIACGANPERFQPRGPAVSNGRLLFVGRLVPQKGLDDLMSALELLPPAAKVGLDIVGDGPLMDKLRERATRVGLTAGHDIRFLGSRDGEWLRSHGPAYLAGVFPFKTAPDGARDTGPLVVKESMAMGLPVISTDYMGVKETITGETGFKVPPGDPASLAAAIAALLDMTPGQRRLMGEAGRRRVISHFTQTIQADELSAMVEAA